MVLSDFFLPIRSLALKKWVIYKFITQQHIELQKNNFKKVNILK